MQQIPPAYIKSKVKSAFVSETTWKAHALTPLYDTSGLIASYRLCNAIEREVNVLMLYVQQY